MTDSATGTPPLFGLETEYAYTVKGGDKHPSDLFLQAARSRLPHLPGPREDLFLANGSRLYVDLGHPELATPECTNPWQAVRYCLAGDRIVADVAGHLDGGEAWVSKCNVDYSGARTTWACHSSFLYRCDRSVLFKQLIPHLVSRIIYTGAGGWDPFADELHFTLSPRSLHLSHVLSEDRNPQRGLISLRDESLSRDGNCRLHLQGGESVESQTAIFLAVGTTALIIALTEAGVDAAAGLELFDPLTSIRHFAFDPHCRRTTPTASGNLVSAIDIQRQYLAVAEKHAGERFMPRWTPQVCRLWRSILDRLEQGAPWSVADTLDWAIKYALYDRMRRRAGQRPGQLMLEFVAPTAELREQLLETDMRFAQVTGTGLFRQLDQTGVLQHRVAGVGDVARAIHVPPAGSRAAVRGRLVQELHGQSGDTRAYWDWIWNHGTQKGADLSDPFCQQVVWGPIADRAIALRDGVLQATMDTIYEAGAFYRRGHYVHASDLLASVSAAQISSLPCNLQIRYWRYRAWIQARQGQLGGMELLDRAPQRDHDMQYLHDHLTVARFQGLAVPVALTREWIDRAEALMRTPDLQLKDLQSAVWDHIGAYLLRCNRLEEAVALFRASQSNPEPVDYIRGRSAALLAETYRRLNQPAAAHQVLTAAARIHGKNHIDGDRTDFNMCIRAKLEPDTTRARRWLKRAEKMQVWLQNHVGLTRTLLLQGRFARSIAEQARLKSRVIGLAEGLPAVRDCEVYQRVMRDWDLWIGNNQATDEHGDRFWGV